MNIKSKSLVSKDWPWNALLAVVFCITLALILSSINRGLELSDEAFYLYYVINFDDMAASITPFGYVLQPLFVLLGSSIIAIRIAGVAFLLTVGAVLGASLAIYYSKSHRDWNIYRLILTTALCNLAYYVVWSLTPGYNLMILGAVELLIAGALIASSQTFSGGRSVAIAGSLIGTGAFLAFFAKPTVAALCALAILPLSWSWVHLHGWRGAVARLAVAAAVCVTLFAATLIPDGRASKLFVETIIGLEHLKFGNSPGELVIKTGVDFYRSSPFLWVVLTAFTVSAVLTRHNAVTDVVAFRRIALATLSTALFFLTMNIASSIQQKQSPYMFVFLPVVCAVVGTSLWLYSKVGEAPDLDFKAAAVPIVLIGLPVVVAFGSSIAIFVQSGMYLPLTLIGAIVWFRIICANRWSAVCEIVVITSVPLFVLWSMFLPFHQANSVFASNTEIRFGPSNDRLLVSAVSAKGMTTLSAAGRDQNMNGRIPVVDLTGTGASVALLLNGRAPFYPYIATALGRPRPLADQVWIRMTDLERRQAWIVTPIDAQLIESLPARYFATQRHHYTLAAHVNLPVHPGARRSLDVWRPTDRIASDRNVTKAAGK